MPTSTPLRKVEPYEVLNLPPIPAEPTLDQAIRDVVTAVNGFPYAGDRSSAIVGAISWLRHNPEHAAVLLTTEVSA